VTTIGGASVVVLMGAVDAAHSAIVDARRAKPTGHVVAALGTQTPDCAPSCTQKLHRNGLVLPPSAQSAQSRNSAHCKVPAIVKVVVDVVDVDDVVDVVDVVDVDVVDDELELIVEQDIMLHVSVSDNVGHVMPVPACATAMARARVREPPPHVAVHVVHDDHALT
jgi:hypothetical protein